MPVLFFASSTRSRRSIGVCIHQPCKPISSSELQLRQSGVHAPLPYQLSMAAFFDDAAVVKHQDAVC